MSELHLESALTSREAGEPLKSSNELQSQAHSASQAATFQSENKDNDVPYVRRFFNRLVVTEDNPARKVWSCVLAVLLVYTGTVFPAKLAFCDFAIPTECGESPEWTFIHDLNDALFVIDLVVCFFFTYRDDRGIEVLDLCCIVRRYVSTYFIINLVACIPPGWIGDFIEHAYDTDASDSEVHKSLRLTRLQRVSRLARLVRLVRLTKLVSWLRDSPFLTWLQSLRTTRVFNFIAGLTWACHLMACGWYFVAAVHSDYKDTWVYRRFGDDIAEIGPFTHWLNSMYWVLTVFTTVGFGDISPATEAEIVYGMITMLVGAVANGIILSEVINIITEADQFAREIQQQKALVQGFSQHVKLRSDCIQELEDWVGNARAFHYTYDRKQMKDMFLGNSLPTTLISKIPDAVFGGLLSKNRFIMCACANQLHVPARFVMLVALSVNARMYDCRETVYHAHDHAWNIFLVQTGVFANVAKPTSMGGISEVPDLLSQAGRNVFSTATRKNNAGNAEADIHWTLPKDANGNDQTKRPSLGSLRRKKKHTAGVETKGFVPYQLFCFGNYFGDVELLRNRKGSRRSCVRCESKTGGTLLVLGKRDLEEVTKAFPMSYGAWRVIAAQREVKRKQLVSKLKTNITYERLAASIIVWHAREHLARRGFRLYPAGTKEWGLDPIESHGSFACVSSMPTGNYDGGAFAQRWGPQNNMSEQSEEIDGLNQRVNALQADIKLVHSKLDLLLERCASKPSLAL